jgi:MFS family permease
VLWPGSRPEQLLLNVMADRVRRPPFYGWIVVSSLSLTQVVSWGIVYYAFAVFMAPMTRELGWSQTQIAGAFSLAVLASAIAALPLGHYIDRYGARPILLTGSCIAVLLLIAWARVQTLVAFYAIWCGMGVAMAATLYEPAFAIAVAWFIRRRALALTILTSVGGLASTIFVPAIAASIDARGWRATLLGLAGLLAIVNVPLYAFVVRSRPSDLRMRPDGDWDAAPDASAAARRPVSVKGTPETAWMLAIIFGLSSLSSAAAAVHVFPFLVARGFTTQSAALGIAAVGAAQVPARLAFGAVARFIPGPWIAPSIFAMQALAFACLGFTSRTSVFVGLFAILFGCANGLMTLVKSMLVADRFDLTRYGSISGTIAFCGQLARAVGPIVAAWLASVWQYEPVWWLLAGVLCIGAVAMRVIERQPAAGLAMSEPEPRYY